MIIETPVDVVSRIDMLFMDRDATSADESRRRRARRCMETSAGDDVADSFGLQLALITIVNLGVKCFAENVSVVGNSKLWDARCLIPHVQAATLGDAIVQLGCKIIDRDNWTPSDRYLLVGNGPVLGGAVRITYDGWVASVGPALEISRLNERAFCPLASIAAAALGVSELFSAFANINVTATRRAISFSLWRPDLSPLDNAAIGKKIAELPLSIAVCGLGHLGQAYIWALAALPYRAPQDLTVYLYDDDIVKKPNLETGALLNSQSLGAFKTRTVAGWLENRGIQTRLIERRIDHNYRRSEDEPLIALAGFDDNQPRQWLTKSGFSDIFDCGLGAEFSAFDTVAFHAWPNPREPEDIWIVESSEQLLAREAKKLNRIRNNVAYNALGVKEGCGLVEFSGTSVAVPFVGAIAGCMAVAEMLKAVNGGPIFHDIKMKICSASIDPLVSRLAAEIANPMRGISTQLANNESPD